MNMDLKFVFGIVCLLAAFVPQNVYGQRQCLQATSDETYAVLNRLNNKPITVVYFIGATLIPKCMTFTFTTLPYNQWTIEMAYISLGQDYHQFFTLTKHDNNTATATPLGQREGPRIYLKALDNGIIVVHYCKGSLSGELTYVGFPSCGLDLSVPARFVADVLSTDPDQFEVDSESCPI